MRKPIFVIAVCLLFLRNGSGAEQGLPVDRVIQLYVQALGGEAALNRIVSRQLEVKGGRLHGKVKYIWQAPDKVLRINGAERQGSDGKTAWLETKRKKVQKLPQYEAQEMLTDANPVRYAHLHKVYVELHAVPRESFDGAAMDVLMSPNHVGNSKLYFDASTHLLRRIEDFGGSSAYFKHVTEFSEYEDFDGVKLPTEIERRSEEPGAERSAVRLTKIEQNVEVNAALFVRPNIASEVLGGKR